MKKVVEGLLVMLVFMMPNNSSAADLQAPAEPSCLTSFFAQSIHHTGEGMRRWYEEKGGFMEITKIPYDQLNCKSCHVSTTMACYNCHFDTFLKTGSKEGNFVPMKDWLLLINYEGQVTSGNAMALVYQNKKFIAYVPYHTHSVSSEGRECNDCHLNPAVIRIQKGEKVPVVDFKNGQVIPWKGVVPVVDGKLDWVFLNRTKTGWEPVPAGEAPQVQFAAYGSALTQEQFQKLAEKVPDDGKK